jgi:hypothetical protein
MARAEDAMGMATAAVAHKSKIAKHNFFIELLKKKLLK